MRDFGEILAENRKKKGYSQSDLVKLLSQEGIQVTTKAISKWETRACLKNKNCTKRMFYFPFS